MAKKSTAQIWLEYNAVRVVLGLLGLMPRKAAIFIGVSIGRLAFHLFGKFRHVGLRNLELAYPDKTDAERKYILKGAFRNLGRVMAIVSAFGGLTVENLPDLIEYRPDPEFAAQ